MQKAFDQHIEDSFPELKEATSIVACSGGLDSVVLVHLCKAAGLEFSIAHCNFQLRGKESDSDEDFVGKLAASTSNEYFVKHFDTREYVVKHKLSVQMAARELRYGWFEELIRQQRAEFILTAHQADDDLETFIINLSRGTGIKGLSGIPPRTGAIRRPLLEFSRQEILAYARQNNIKWREDSTNLERTYLRNKIRHDVIPGLRELNPAFLENFKSTQSYLKGIQTIVNNHTRELRKNLFQAYKTGWKIDIEALQKLQPQPAYLHAIFSDYGFSEWTNVTQLLTALSGKEVVSKTHRLIKDREVLILTPIVEGKSGTFEFSPANTCIEVPIPMQIDLVDKISERSRGILYVDKETLNHRLEVRKWKKGDYFYPLGMGGRKLVSKFFKDEKYDALEKENQWLLFSGDKLVWVIGKRADERFKVSPDTKEILRFQLKE